MLLDDQLLDELQQEAKASPRLRMHRDMRTTSADTSQRMLNAVEPGTQMPIHRHRFSSEMQVLLRGRIDVVFYNDSGFETDRFALDPRAGRYAVNVPLGQWHNFEVLDPSVVFSAKDGAYKSQSSEDIMSK